MLIFQNLAASNDNKTEQAIKFWMMKDFADYFLKSVPLSMEKVVEQISYLTQYARFLQIFR